MYSNGAKPFIAFRVGYLLGGCGVVLVRWHGHSCFEVCDSVTIVTDPHDGVSLGLPPPRVKADVVLISHGHDDHASGRSLVAKPDAVVIDEPGAYMVKGARIKGVKAFHDDVQGRRLGFNTIFVFEVEGVRFSHLGDLGHVLTPEQVEEMGQVDVLMVSVGGDYTLAEENIERIGPRVVIPMHYWVEGIIFPYFPLADVEEFLRDRPNVRRLGRPETTYSRETLPTEREIHVFSLEASPH